MRNYLDLIPGHREFLKAAVKDGTLLPLLPRHHIYLTVHGGDGPRFARLFQETWKRVPCGARQHMPGLLEERSYLWTSPMPDSRARFVSIS